MFSLIPERKNAIISDSDIGLNRPISDSDIGTLGLENWFLPQSGFLKKKLKPLFFLRPVIFFNGCRDWTCTSDLLVMGQTR